MVNALSLRLPNYVKNLPVLPINYFIVDLWGKVTTKNEVGCNFFLHVVIFNISVLLAMV